MNTAAAGIFLGWFLGFLASHGGPFVSLLVIALVPFVSLEAGKRTRLSSQGRKGSSHKGYPKHSTDFYALCMEA